MQEPWFSNDKSRTNYFNIIQSQLSLMFPEFVANLQEQSSFQRELGRAAVFEYTGDICSNQVVFHSSAQLHEHIDRCVPSTALGPIRRLFVLEDLSRNFIEVLGSHLGIPPNVFAAHWNDPTAPTFNHRSPFVRFSKDRFLIRYASCHSISIGASTQSKNNMYSYNSNARRFVYTYDQKGPLSDIPKSYHTLSFWSTGKRDNGSWDAILLVDPSLGDVVRTVPSFEKVKVYQQHSRRDLFEYLYPEFDVVHILSRSSLSGDDYVAQPCYLSMFDDILVLTQARKCEVNSDPRSSTLIARKLVISVFLAFVRRRHLNILKLYNTPPVLMNRCDYLRDFERGKLSSWQHQTFGFIVNVKCRMNILIKEVEENMVALGFVNQNATGSTENPGWELDGWKSIHENCTTVLQMADMFLQSYLQSISIQEARTSNKDAQGMARITALATLFIPLSTVAGILSMNEEYLPGREKAWIYWVVCLPIILLVLLVYVTLPHIQLEWLWFRDAQHLHTDKKE